MLTRKPFAGPAKTRIDFVRDQTRAKSIANFPQHFQKTCWWNVNATANLDGLNDDCPDVFRSKNRFNPLLYFWNGFCRADSRLRKLHKTTESAKLILKWLAKMQAMRCI